MVRYAVYNTVGNIVEVLGVYDNKADMLKNKAIFEAEGRPGTVTGISGFLDEKGHKKAGERYEIY